MITLGVLVFFFVMLMIDIFFFSREPKKKEVYNHPDLDVCPTMCDGGELIKKTKYDKIKRLFHRTRRKTGLQK
jgi:hypothetical protein